MTSPVANHWPRTRDREQGPVTREQRAAELAAIARAVAEGRVKRLPSAGSAPASVYVRSGRFGLVVETP